MEKRKLGRIEVSPIGMGCMALSHGYGKIPEESYSIEAIRKAHAFGCTFFDTAEVYGAQLYHVGHNEEIVGKALAGLRHEAVIATKIHFKGTGTDYHKGDPLYPILKAHLSASLRRLRTDYVDLYYLHRVHPEMELAEVAEAFGKLIQDGLIRGWGLSQVSVTQLAEAHQVAPVTAVQNLYNILERDCEKEIFPFCLQHHIGVVPFSPIASGFLSGKITADTQFEQVDDVRAFVPQLTRENIAANQPILALIKQLAAAKQATPAQISLAWMLKKYPNVVPIPGSKNQERILENLGAWSVVLSDAEFDAFEKALNALPVHGHRGHVENEESTMKDWHR